MEMFSYHCYKYCTLHIHFIIFIMKVKKVKKDVIAKCFECVNCTTKEQKGTEQCNSI